MKGIQPQVYEIGWQADSRAEEIFMLVPYVILTMCCIIIFYVNIVAAYIILTQFSVQHSC